MLEASGLPLDLSYLPLIESAFSLKAYSRARAHGMWQFISATGRHYGLEVGTLVDERRDPVRSTEAAAAYLSDLYGEFSDWYLALAAYNSGAGNVRRAIRKSGSRDFWTLRKYLPRETRNYVPAFIASVIVAKDPEAFGFTAPQEQPWNYDSVDVPDALDLQFMASKSGIPLDELRELNPAIRRDLTPARSTTALRLPLGTADAAQSVLDSNPRSDWAPRMIHTVRSGESLYTIARKYGSNVSAIRQANGLRSSLIHPGDNLIVPRFGTETTVAARPTFTASAEGLVRGPAKRHPVGHRAGFFGFGRQPVHGQRTVAELGHPAGPAPAHSRRSNSRGAHRRSACRCRSGFDLHRALRRHAVRHRKRPRRIGFGVEERQHDQRVPDSPG